MDRAAETATPRSTPTTAPVPGPSIGGGITAISPGLGQLPTLFGMPRRTHPPRPPVQVLLTREIPHISGVRAVLQQRRLLGGRGLKPKSHATTLTTTTDISRRERRSLPGRKAGVFTPRSR
ncbi:hypothetical protein Airi01_040820 [Actinoallomurus iriomotensis]|uniref:Uncharacterized protein n=1 Tax=Actinoallomurus iriomotensis TaxID=478107 RepID=A0A9W6VPL3_9ACTN|nr:hypothetical protein Airi01_040820 [Actinoallomurus iriomotensis]